MDKKAQDLKLLCYIQLGCIYFSLQFCLLKSLIPLHEFSLFAALEAAEDSGQRSGDILRDMPRVKKVLHQLLGDLGKVRKMSMFH